MINDSRTGIEPQGIGGRVIGSKKSKVPAQLQPPVGVGVGLGVGAGVGVGYGSVPEILLS